MEAGTRIAVNTFAQYARTLLNVLLGLYSTRLVLEALGSSDYGIYMLVSGIVTMLSFLTNALSLTTTRFLSVEQGAGNYECQELVYANSLFIHLLLGIMVGLLLEVVGIFLFDGALNIAPDRIPAAKTVYHLSVAMVFVSIMTSPLRASLVAHENLVFASVVDVADGVLKVVAAIALGWLASDRLTAYAAMMLGVFCFSFLCFLTYASLRYRECRFPTLRRLKRGIIRELASFAGWSIYSMGCIFGRNQGTAIVLNRFFGTVINASYGIATTAFGAVSYVASAIQTAFNPQISKSYGDHNPQRMMRLSMSASKFSYLLTCMVGIPVISRMQDILHLWLGNVPERSVLLCSVLIITSIADQPTSGLICANRAIGKLRLYSLLVDSWKIITIPLLTILLAFGTPLEIAIWTYAATEFIASIVRFPVLKRHADFSVRKWVNDIYLRASLPVIFLIACYWLLSIGRFNIFIFIAEFLSVSILFAAVCYYVAFDTNEKRRIHGMAQSAWLKLRKK